MAGKTSKAIETGEHIVIGGLALQIVFFGFFILVGALFDFRLNRDPTVRSQEVPWKRHIKTLYAASVLILIRSIFRIVEYQQGFDGYLLDHEVFLYIFDAVLMLGTMVLFNAVHPSEISTLLRREKLSGGGSELVSLDSVR